MFRVAFQLFRFRGLLATLTSRELKARYRGSVLGFFWSFINPLLLLSIYTFVFTTVMPGARSAGIEPFSLFLFCGLLPWTWFATSLTESSGVLISGGNLIKKVLFPAEILPIVSVLANMVHFLLGLPILAGWSRKGTLGRITGRDVGDRLVASVTAALAAVQHGARIVRVHDVAATVDALKVWAAAGLPA